MQTIKHVSLVIKESLPDDLGTFDVVVTAELASFAEHDKQLGQFVRKGGGWLHLVDLSEKPLPEIFGVRSTNVCASSEVRVLFEDKRNPLAKRLPDAFYASGIFQGLEIIVDDVETILYADWHYTHRPVLVKRPAGEGFVACTTLQAFDNPIQQKIIYRLLLNLSKQSSSYYQGINSLNVGIVGYAQSVGLMHGLGVSSADGLELTGVCDLNPERVEQASLDFPGVKTFLSSNDFANDSSIDLVIVATAPNTHTKIALQMMAEGKHVVCEKPLALNTDETNAMCKMSVEQGVHLSCHQNRRFDVDYLAIKKALDEGLLGDLFYIETFVGGFSHPCGYWHSHDTISGGTAFDSGGHYLDWIVSLILNL